MTGASTTATLLGRDSEQRAMDAVIDEARAGGPSVLMLVGEPGIGKSALLADVRARHPEATVVVAVGVEAEQSIPFAALTTLLIRHAETLERLDAATAATLRSVSNGTTTASLPAVALALVELLATLADDGLVLVVLDDAHWFDPSSRAAVEFALRRLGDLPVATVVASRRADALDLPSTELRLGPLDRTSARTLLDSGGRVADGVSDRCWELCGGNPLILIEVGHALTAEQRTGIRPLPELLPVAGRLERWLADRLVDLPEPTRRALATLALAGSAPLTAVLQALDALALRRADLDPAEAAGVVVTSGAEIRFTHPLFATVAADSVDRGTRRSTHRALAGISDESGERRAWHLVEACETAADVADATSALRELAARATDNGAHLTAADAWERLATLLADAGDRAEALTAAGAAKWDAGRPDLALPLLRDAYDLVPPGPTRAAATDVLGHVIGWYQSIDHARRLLEGEVVHIERDHPDLAVRLLASSATLASLATSPDGVAVTEWAEAIAERGDHVTRLAAHTVGTHVRLVAGEGSAIGERLDELDALNALIRDGIDRSVLEPAQLLAFGLMVRERWDDARDAYRRIVGASRAASLGGVESFALAMSAEVAWRTGRWTQARGEAAADAAFHAPVDGLQGTFGDATMARVEAALGMVDDAKAHAQRAVERGDDLGMHSMSAWGRHALGLADLATGDAASALKHLEWIWELTDPGSTIDPGLLWWQGDLLEALVAGGRPDDARRLVRQLVEQAAASGRRWPEAIAARGRGVLEADRRELERSIAVLDDLDAPFEAARSRLLLSSLLDGDDATAELDGARRVFERLGAAPWTRRCAATGVPPDPEPKGSTALASRLTPAELRVATAVGSGLATRAAAGSLALSTRTVDAHLRSIYRKLGINSRAQLAVLVSASDRDQR